jgi:hypothetical protein
MITTDGLIWDALILYWALLESSKFQASFGKLALGIGEIGAGLDFSFNGHYNIHNSQYCYTRDIMISIEMKSPFEVTREIAKKAKDKRLNLNLSQQTLSEKSGVSYGTLKKFEQKGQISLESLLKIALALGELNKFEQLFAKGNDQLPASLDEILADNHRKRGRK